MLLSEFGGLFSGWRSFDFQHIVRLFFHRINSTVMFYLKILLFSIFGILVWYFWGTRYLTIAYWIALGEKGWHDGATLNCSFLLRFPPLFWRSLVHFLWPINKAVLENINNTTRRVGVWYLKGRETRIPRSPKFREISLVLPRLPPLHSQSWCCHLLCHVASNHCVFFVLGCVYIFKL